MLFTGVTTTSTAPDACAHAREEFAEHCTGAEGHRPGPGGDCDDDHEDGPRRPGPRGEHRGEDGPEGHRGEDGPEGHDDD